MRWGNAWAWAGLLLLALPILVHLLARRTAKLQRFPTLRFLGTARLLPRRSPRLTDPLLLLLRLAIVAAAVTALAQPTFLGNLGARGTQSLTRVIVLDTSASMRRLTAGGEPAVSAARRSLQQLQRGASGSVVIETAAPAGELAGAAAWLGSKTSRREVVLLSDFQLGTIDSLTLASIPQDIGIRLVQTPVPSRGVGEVVSREQGSEAVARITIDGAQTAVDWQLRAPAQQYGPAVQILAGARERAAANAALQAALTLGTPSERDTTHDVAILYPDYERRLDLIRKARALNQPWMADVFARLHADSLLVGAAAAAEVLSLPAAYDTAYTVVARNAVGQPVVLAAAANEQMLLLPLVEAGSLTSAALIAAAEHALSQTAPVTELEPATVPRAVLQRWERAPGQLRLGPAGTPNDHSDGRWFWVLSLLLLIIEGVVRRRPERAAQAPRAKRTEVHAGARSNAA